MSANVDDVISGPSNAAWLGALDSMLKAHGHGGLDAQGPRPTAGASFQASPTIGKLAGALAKAQGAFEAIGKTREVKVQMKTGGSYTFAYAPLDEVLRAVRPAMASNGLALTQTVADGEKGRTMTTTLLHESGEWMASTTTLPGQATTAQEFGSQITYMRRYAIVAILGVVADEDDDANAADGNNAQGRDRPTGGNSGPKAQGGGADPKGAAPSPSPLRVVTASSGESAPASSTSTPPVDEEADPNDLVDCYQLVKTGLKKAGNAEYRFEPIGRQARRTEAQHIRMQQGRKELGLTDDDWRSDLRARYSKETSKDLSVAEADDFLAHLRKRWNQRKYKHPNDKAAAKEQRATEVPPEMREALGPGVDG